jgi:hypothetical protein
MRHTPPGANCSTSVAKVGDLTKTASWAEYVVRSAPDPTRTSMIGLFIKLTHGQRRSNHRLFFYTAIAYQLGWRGGIAVAFLVPPRPGRIGPIGIQMASHHSWRVG